MSYSATLRTTAQQAPLSMGFSGQEHWSGLPFPPPGDLPHPGIEPTSPASPALAGRFFNLPGLIPGLGRHPGDGKGYPPRCSWASLVAQLVKSPPTMRETWVRPLGGKRPLEKGMAPTAPFWPGESHTQSPGSHRVRRLSKSHFTSQLTQAVA